MKRRHVVKAIALGSITPHLLVSASSSFAIAPKSNRNLTLATFQSTWQQWPDMPWVGPEYWGNRLQDWEIQQGRAVCVISDKNRSLHSLTHQLGSESGNFSLQVKMEWLNPEAKGLEEAYAGFRMAAKGKFTDYRSAAVFGQGLDAGINGQGHLFIGEKTGTQKISLDSEITLHLEGTGNEIQLKALNSENGKLLGILSFNQPGANWEGNLALITHFPGDATERPSVAFSDWQISGDKIVGNETQVFGPICFAQYTLHRGILKLAAQLAPVDQVAGMEVRLQVKKDGQWTSLQQAKPDTLGRVVHFRQENWNAEQAVPYRVKLDLPLKSGRQSYFYEGTIAREPASEEKVKMAVFSCNADYGFPDQEVSIHVPKHQPDLAVFLGDQFYESTGGFGIQTSPLKKSSLDYLRKWYMFGWSYREIFRHIPSAFIPDDHDVYHGNVWGEAGKSAPTDEGWGYVAQDQGGYKMPPEWVNMVQLTQTGHLPDPYDPTPVKQGITTYYTDWLYGGVSFAILEDRKFKSAPKNVLPEEAKVLNGFIQNPEFDIKAHYDIDAELLGERQLKFLKHWSSDWSQGTEMKAVISQTNFCTVATLPKGSIIDSIVPKLPIPKPGEYVSGDAPTTDMDSNGWPQKGRDEALRIIRKAFALHVAGDQHLASVVHYGVEEHGDAGFAFAGPALNNLFPRRWWPEVPAGHAPLPGRPDYTGNFEDGFGNKITVHAVANPHITGREPALIYDRATGYGMVTFDKIQKNIRIECWPRYVDPEKNPNGQYNGWPVTITQQDNYAKASIGTLPELDLSECHRPIVQVIDENSGELVYSLRVGENRFRPKIFKKSNYLVRVWEDQGNREQVFSGLALDAQKEKSLWVNPLPLKA
ncbi:alkaline phosphatase D family protein [Cyclobacterium jeungdonense]|uniref:Alkaline phosphatase D family protein n=1 Tax=Cyclobacterium jeungdonense TaxID=708087 RepID=A0ABT8C0N5_9BACT|nr:alkaline phosphatase D family protein [Cyclobacterium jeungdonense]MDN3686246.1 alkaline phosphatase D family protein [Cyclobacterium jeungdonense]